MIMGATRFFSVQASWDNMVYVLASGWGGFRTVYSVRGASHIIQWKHLQTIESAATHNADRSESSLRLKRSCDRETLIQRSLIIFILKIRDHIAN